MKPKLSIGLPVYNGLPYLPEALETLLSQDWGDFELLISDNMSTDGSCDIAADFARKDRRIQFQRQPRNLGAAANFNQVFRMGSAPYFKWACADDTTEPGFLGRAVAEMKAHPEMVLCYGQVTLIDEAGRSLSDYQRQGFDLRSPDAIARFRSVRDYQGPMNVLQGVIRTGALRRTRLMGAFPASDVALAVELTLHGTFREIPDPMLRRRMHPEAASAGRTVEARQIHLNPATRGKLHLENWRRSSEHLQAILRAPVSLPERIRLLGVETGAMARQHQALRWELAEAGRVIFARMFGRRVSTTQVHTRP